MACATSDSDSIVFYETGQECAAAPTRTSRSVPPAAAELLRPLPPRVDVESNGGGVLRDEEKCLLSGGAAPSILALRQSILQLCALPLGALALLSASHRLRSFCCLKTVCALGLPRTCSSAARCAVKDALLALVRSKLLFFAGLACNGDSRRKMRRYAPLHAAAAATAAISAAGGVPAEAAHAAAAAAGEEGAHAGSPVGEPPARKRQRAGGRCKPEPGSAAGAPPHVDELGCEAAGPDGLLRFHLRDSASGGEVCVVAEAAPGGGACGAARRRIFRITRAVASLAPPSLRAALLPRASDVRDWLAAVLESRLLGGAEPDAAAAKRFAPDPNPELFSSASDGDGDDGDAARGAAGAGDAMDEDGEECGGASGSGHGANPPPHAAGGWRPAACAAKANAGAAGEVAAAAAAGAAATHISPPWSMCATVAARVDALLLPGGALCGVTRASGRSFCQSDVESHFAHAAGRSIEPGEVKAVNTRLRDLAGCGALHCWSVKEDGAIRWAYRFQIADAACMAGAAIARSAAAPTTKRADTATRIAALVSPPSGALYLRSIQFGFFIRANACECLCGDGKTDVYLALRALVEQGALTAQTVTGNLSGTTCKHTRYAVVVPAAAAAVAAAAARAAGEPKSEAEAARIAEAREEKEE